jgi:hypothetical protein
MTTLDKQLLEKTIQKDNLIKELEKSETTKTELKG